MKGKEKHKITKEGDIMAFNQPNYMQPNYYQPSFNYRYEQPIQTGLKGRPVASIDEAKASMIDFDGSTFYFPDAAKKNIYAKRINIDGTSTLETYVLQEQPQVPEPQYVTMETFQETINAIMAKMQGMAPVPSPQMPQEVKKNDEQYTF